MRKSAMKTRLARARVAAGLTQQEFSKASNVSIDQIRHFERGGRPLTSYVTAAFALILGVSGAWLDGIGDENEPVALDGEPYTREKYLKHKARRLRMPWEGEKELKGEARTLLMQRNQAWSVYLNHLVTGIFSAEIKWHNPLLHEEIGLKILSIIREHASRPLPEYSVDTIMRDSGRSASKISVTKA
jgi:transcriptional regulator with XRE-family HTH domain